MYLLDTNVVSMLDPRRRPQSADVVDWLERNGASLYLSVMTITEMDAGVHKLRREGKLRRADEIAALVSAIISDFSDRVLPMDLETARIVARFASDSYQQTIELPDLVIAATAARHSLTVLTRNMADFRRISVSAIDPFVNLPPDV